MPLGGQKKLNLIRKMRGSHHSSAHKSMPSQHKAKEILRHGEVRGHKLTAKQQGFFGARAGGQPIRKKS